jgi:hypothetical protein
MVVHGYKAGVNFVEVASVLRKHTNMDSRTVKQVVSDIKEGKGINLPDDFVLREDLEDLDILIS